VKTRILTISVMLLTCCVAPLAGAQSALPSTIKLSFSPTGSQPENKVEITLQGKHYKGSKLVPFEEWVKLTAKEFPEEKFIVDFVVANRVADREKMLSMWNAEERSAIETSMSNPQMFERNSALFRNMTTSRLVATIRYGQYSLVIVEHGLQGAGTIVKTYPVIRTNAGYFMSNRLNGDFFYDKLSFAISEYLRI
jgi:hypothetical protein